MKIHLVYATPAFSSFSGKVRSKLRLKAQKYVNNFPLVNRRNPDFSKWPFSNPYSITINLYKALSKRWDVLLYDYREIQRMKFAADDIIIGHPHPDRNRIMNQAILDKSPARARIILQPFHFAFPRQIIYLNELIEKADSFLSITGNYWFDHIDESFVAHWKSKMTRIDMAIDTKDYPFVKHSFHPSGQRKFLYIGSDQESKGVDLLSVLFDLTNTECGWVGWGKNLPNLNHHPKMIFTYDVIQSFANEYDFFITMGLGDANPTTILESMAWGFPVCATPTSGYDNIPSFFMLDTMDMKHNLEIIEQLQDMPEDELKKISRENRKLVEKNYTWEKFTNTVIKTIEQFL